MQCDDEDSLPKVKRQTTTSTFSPTNITEQNNAAYLNQLTATVYSSSAPIPKGASQSAARHGLLSSSLVQADTINITHANITQYNADVMMIAPPAQTPTSRTEEFQQQLKYYYRQSDSHIKRIFGNPIPLSSCFINLAIVTGESQKQDETERLRSQAERSKIYGCYEDIYSTSRKVEIAPKELFISRNDKVPKRIAIIGRAGIGRSTLSQYISSYLWAEQNVWGNQFQAVIKIKLRNLVNDPYNRSTKLADIIEAECLDKTGLTQTLNKNDITATLQAISEETLVILDGWDEYDQYRSPCAAVIEGIMADPKISIIVLSRPYTNLNPRQFDLQLECIGFTSKNIPEYINRALDDKTQAPLIIEFLKRNPAIHSLAHVPIILDMICAVWDEEMRLRQTPMTMTELYNKLMTKFWEAYKQKQRECHPNITLPELNKKKENAKTFLGLLAFKALATNSIMLSYELVKNTIREAYQCDEDDVKDFLQEVLPPGFLNTPDHNQSNGRYYFPHLTVQEYFSATHWVKLFTSQNISDRGNALRFLKDNKFNPQFEIMWWMVSGLLSSHSSDSYLREFFNCIEESPVDVIGLYSNRLMIRCLGEANVPEHLRQTNRLLQLAADSIHHGVLAKLNESGLEKYTLLSAIVLNYKVATRCGILEKIIPLLFESEHNLAESALHALLRLANAAINVDAITNAFQKLSTIKKENTPGKVTKFLQEHISSPLQANPAPEQAAVLSQQIPAQNNMQNNTIIIDHFHLTHIKINALLDSTDETELNNAIETLLKNIQSGDRWQASASVGALATLCCAKKIFNERIYQALCFASRNPHWQVRASVATTLGQLLEIAEFKLEWRTRIEQAIFDMATETDEEVSKQLIQAMHKLIEQFKSNENSSDQNLSFYLKQLKAWKVAEIQIKYLTLIQAIFISSGIERIQSFLDICLTCQSPSVRRTAIVCIREIIQKHGANETINKFVLTSIEDNDNSVACEGLNCLPLLSENNGFSLTSMQALLMRKFDHPSNSVSQKALKIAAEFSSIIKLSESMVNKIILISTSHQEFMSAVAIQALGKIARNNQFAMKIVLHFDGILHDNLAKMHFVIGSTTGYDNTKNEVVEAFRHLLKSLNLEEGKIAVGALLKLFNQNCDWIGGGAATVLRDTNLENYLDLPEWRMLDFQLKKIDFDWNQIFNNTSIDALLRSDLVTNEHFFRLVISNKILEDLQLLSIEGNHVYFIKDYRLQSVSFSPEKLGIFIRLLESFLNEIQQNSKYIPINTDFQERRLNLQSPLASSTVTQPQGDTSSSQFRLM